MCTPCGLEKTFTTFTMSDTWIKYHKKRCEKCANANTVNGELTSKVTVRGINAHLPEIKQGLAELRESRILKN